LPPMLNRLRKSTKAIRPESGRKKFIARRMPVIARGK
jgi:hypothetical protein